jgi:hypothetical protein
MTKYNKTRSIKEIERLQHKEDMNNLKIQKLDEERDEKL